MFIGIGLFWSSCSSKKYISPDEANISSIQFGHGGGFSGRYTEYYLLENGQLFRKTLPDQTITEVSPLSKQVTKQIFSNYNLLQLGQKKVNTSGNLVYYIEHRSNDNKHKLMWERGQDGTQILQTYYTNFMNEVRKINENEPNKPPVLDKQ
jgi:hypothetical protein